MRQSWLVSALLIGVAAFALAPVATDLLHAESAVAWASVDPAPSPSPPPAARRPLTLREARSLGVTVAAVRQAVEDLRKSGDLDASTSRPEMAALVADRLTEKNAQAFRAAAGLDWDALLAFIEKLLPLILRLLGT